MTAKCQTEQSPSNISPAPFGYVKRAFRGGASSETLNPDPVTELPLTPPAEEDEEEAAISPFNLKATEKKLPFPSLPQFC